MVNFAAYLDVNQSAISKSQANIAKLENENQEKRLYIQRQRKKLEYYGRQAKNMAMESAEVEKYKDFLEKVRQENSDEYSEIKDILSRFAVLQKSKADLTEKQQALTNQLEKKKTAVNDQESKLKSQILSLNSDIKNL